MEKLREEIMGKKVYDTVMLIIAVCMLIIAYLTYEATKTSLDVETTGHHLVVEPTVAPMGSATANVPAPARPELQ